VDNLTPSTLILVVLLTIVWIGAIALVVFGITAYKIAVLYAPGDNLPRRIPQFGASPVLEPADAEEDTPVVAGPNGYPTVARGDIGTQIAGQAEVTLVGEREKWWEEQREAGLTDDEISAEEAGRVVPVFED
jgi:hypothetical protein